MHTKLDIYVFINSICIISLLLELSLEKVPECLNYSYFKYNIRKVFLIILEKKLLIMTIVTNVMTCTCHRALRSLEDFYNQYIVATTVRTLYFCIRLHHAFLGVTYILNIRISFFINILPIEIDLQIFTVVVYGKFG